MRYAKILIVLLLIGCTSEAQENNAEKLIISQQKIDAIEFCSNTLYLNLIDAKGDTLPLYTDTGGGNIVYPETVRRLNLDIDTTKVKNRMAEHVNLNTHLTRTGAPPNIGPSFVYREDSPLKDENGGILGTNWFADKKWHFKYRVSELFTVDSLDWELASPSHTVELGFLKDSLGHNATNFPRIPVVVEGDTIQTLFDTGAHAILSDKAKASLGDKRLLGTSFIIASIFDRWRSEHPDWEVIENADSLSGEAMIQVPKVQLGNYNIGPVWFTRRADKNFTKYMSQWMDQEVQGAIGGSAFQYFDSIVLDYNKRLAYFNK